MSRLISRKEAKAKRLKRYFTGKSCPKGHVAERRTLSGGCVECVRAGNRQWRAAHPERTRENNQRWQAANLNRVRYLRKRWYSANSDKEKESVKRWQAANSEKIKRARKRRYAANPGPVLARCKQRYAANPERAKENAKRRYKSDPERAKERMRCWRKTNPGKWNAITAKRRSAKMKRTPPWADLKQIEKLYQDAKVMTKLLGEPFHVDHVIPLQGKLVSGLHVPSNLQILPGRENCKKSNKFDPQEAAQFT